MHLSVLQWRVLLNAAGPSPYPPSHLQGDCIWGALAVLGDMKAAGALPASLAAPTAGQAQHRQCPGNTGASPRAAALPRPHCATAARAVPAVRPAATGTISNRQVQTHSRILGAMCLQACWLLSLQEGTQGKVQLQPRTRASLSNLTKLQESFGRGCPFP